jgi:uncharacterized protein (DUF1684 family)
MTGSDEIVDALVSLTAVVQLHDQRLELVRHPADGRIVAFSDADDAFGSLYRWRLLEWPPPGR